MSILNVNTIQPVGSGQTITVSATNITASSAALTVGSITNTSGSTVVAAGSTAAPSISPTGDSNTGIFFPSADTIAFGEGGVEAARIDSSGRLGIGTDIPSSYDSGARTLVLSESLYSGITLRTNNQSTGQNSIYFSDGLTGNEAYRGRIEYSHSSDSLNFGTAGTGSKLTLTSAGAVQIANGNLVFSTAGTGIDFSATANSSGTVGSEVLSDYEEGTWTPTWVPNAGSIVNSYGSGKYVKVGDMVTLWGYYGFSSSSGVSAGDTIRLGGFPFSTPSTTFGQAATGIGLLNAQYGWNTPPEQTVQLIASATATEDLFKKGTTFAPGGTKLTYSDLQTSSNYSQIVFWASYRAS